MKGLIDRLEELGALQTVDAALGRLLATRSDSNGETIGLIAALTSSALAQGHSCLPLDALHAFTHARVIEANNRSDMPAKFSLQSLPSVDAMRAALRQSPWVARDGVVPAALVLDAQDRVYLRRYFNYERSIAYALLNRTMPDELHQADDTSLRESLARYFDRDADNDDDQRTAVLLALRSRFLIVSGGPGTGKTSTVLRVLAITIEQALATGSAPPRIALTAPTGKAAARLSETLRAPHLALSDATRAALPTAATTLHRLLGIMPGRARPRYDRAHPLPYDLIVVDEASMLDLALAARLCDALGAQTRLILLGDRDQLASVEAGSVFGALCSAAGEANRYSPATATWLKNILFDNNETRIAQNVGARFIEPALAAIDDGRDESRPYKSPTAPLIDALVELRSNHRFEADSAIAGFARAVRLGDGLAAKNILSEGRAELQVETVAETALTHTVLTQVLPHFAQFATLTTPDAALDHLDRFRVLCALRESPFGAVAINALIEHELRRQSTLVDAQGWFAGRRVMIAANDYAQGLFNGDIGVALSSGVDGSFEVWFRRVDGTARALPPALLPKFEGAFALTVHKAQGSEFDDVLIVLPPRDARVLTRELLYTAVTRARKNVRLWASEDILVASIARSTQRWSGLGDALNGSSPFDN